MKIWLLNEQWFGLQRATTTMMNSASVRLQQAGNDDNGSAFNEQWFEGISRGKWSELVIHFVVTTPVFLLSSSKYASADLDVWRQPGIYLHDFFGNPTAPHSRIGNLSLIGRSLAPSSFPTSIPSTTNFFLDHVLLQLP